LFRMKAACIGLLPGSELQIMFSVLIVGNHPITCSGLKHILNEEFRDVVVGEARTGDEALSKAAKLAWTLIVLDMDSESASPVLGEIRRKRSEARVLVLSMRSEPQYAARALRLGALGYVTKDAGRNEFLAAFNRVRAGKKYVGASLAPKLDAYLIDDSDVGPEVLSSRERAVLLALATGKRIHEIARELDLDENTVSTYRRRILDKLHLHSLADLVRYVSDRHIS
jgi:two-component system, NarL family, invasion response regulator UvrY